jgi:hypothetical protein
LFGEIGSSDFVVDGAENKSGGIHSERRDGMMPTMARAASRRNRLGMGYRAEVFSEATLPQLGIVARNLFIRRRNARHRCRPRDATTGVGVEALLYSDEGGLVVWFSLYREADVSQPVRHDGLTLDEAEEILNTWKLRGFHYAERQIVRALPDHWNAGSREPPRYLRSAAGLRAIPMLTSARERPSKAEKACQSGLKHVDAASAMAGRRSLTLY